MPKLPTQDGASISTSNGVQHNGPLIKLGPSKWEVRLSQVLHSLWAEFSTLGGDGWGEEELAHIRGVNFFPPTDDAQLLMRLRVTIAEPKTVVEYGKAYRIGNHLLVIADVVHEVALWRRYLDSDNIIFCPYPGPLILNCEAASSGDKRLLMVQPDPYIAGLILDYYYQVREECERHAEAKQ